MSIFNSIENHICNLDLTNRSLLTSCSNFFIWVLRFATSISCLDSSVTTVPLIIYV